MTRGYLGISSQAITPALAAAMHLPGRVDEPVPGALVSWVETGSPAAKAGILPGDVIEQSNGTSVAGPHDLAVDVANTMPGTAQKLTFLRNGQIQFVTATMTELPRRSAGTDGGEALEFPKLGLAFQALTPELRERIAVPPSLQGALIAQVRPGSPADLSGIQVGDVLVGVGTVDTPSPEAAGGAIGSALADAQDVQGVGSVALRILRNGQSEFVALSLPDRRG